MTNCWKGDPLLAHQQSEEDPHRTSTPLESSGEEKKEEAVLALTWSTGPQSGTEANGCCVEHGAEVAPKGKGISCHYGTNNAEGE